MGLEISKNTPKDPRILIQKPLALLAAGLDPNETDKRKCSQAILDWTQNGAAANFREFVEMHPDVKLDPDDVDGMRQIIEEMRTLH